MAEKKSSIRVELLRSSEVVEGDKSPSSPPRVAPSWGLLVSQGFSNCKLFLTLMSKKWYMITLIRNLFPGTVANLDKLETVS